MNQARYVKEEECCTCGNCLVLRAEIARLRAALEMLLDGEWVENQHDRHEMLDKARNALEGK